MNLFCRILGHTWVHKVDEPKIRWATAKNLSELDQQSYGEPRVYLECARCKQQRDWDSALARGATR